MKGTALRRLALAALLLAHAPFAVASRADTDVAGATLSGEAEIGGRTITGDNWGESGKYGEYREQDPGIFGGGHFMLENKTEPYWVRGWLEDVGEDDQSYRFEAGRWGRFKLGLEYSELPHLYSREARSLYSEHDGISNFPDAFQSALQAAAASSSTQSTLLGQALALSPGRDIDFHLRQGKGNFEANLTEDLDLFASYGLQERKGSKPFSIGFGSPGGTFANFAEPIDQKTHEVNAGARWSRDRWSLEAGYLGSFFDDDFDRLLVDNPLRSTDSASSGPMRGRITPPPSNSAHTFRLAGATSLPVGFPAHLAANVSYGRRFQDESFLCHTINTAILPDPQHCSGTGSRLDLPKGSLDGDVRTLNAGLVATARPWEPLNLTARYRLYDLDNHSRQLAFDGHVVNDQSEADEIRRSVANEYQRQNASLEAAWRVTHWATLRTGYELEHWDRSDDREVTKLDEQRPSVGVDLRPAPWSQIHATYEYGVRRGNGYDPFAYLEQSYDLSHLSHEERASTAAGIIFPPQRKFDMADRQWNTLNLISQFAPRENLTLSLTGSLGKTNYDHTSYGLESDERYSVGGETSWRPFERLGVSGWYSYEDIRYEQKSRWRPVSGDDTLDSTLNDWSSRSRDMVHNFGLDFDLTLIPDRLDAGFGYGIQYAEGETHSRGRGGCAPTSGACIPFGTQADGGNASDYPDLKDVLQDLHATLRYHLNESLTLQASWAYEKYDIHDFRHEGLDPFEPDSNVNGSGVVSPSRDVFLADRLGAYDAHILALSLIYKF